MEGLAMRPRFLRACCVLCVCCFWAALILAGWAPGQPGRAQTGGGPPQPGGGEAQRGGSLPFGRVGWEYRVVSRADILGLAGKEDKDKFTAGLNRLGAEGWELVAIEAPLVHWFKRPAAPSPAADRGRRDGGAAGNRGQRRPAGKGPDAPARPAAAAAAEIKVFRLKFAPAQDAEAVLSKVLLAGGGGEGLRLASDPRTNSVVAQGAAARLQEVEALLAQLDTPDERRPAGGK
jgi:hypothetical protein